jgi:hypothetical protein
MQAKRLAFFCNTLLLPVKFREQIATKTQKCSLKGELANWNCGGESFCTFASITFYFPCE